MSASVAFRFGAAVGLMCLAPAAALLAVARVPQQPATRPGEDSSPKRLLVVSVTAGFRHDSIEVGEKVLRELARRSGDFTLDFASVNPRDPKYAPKAGDRAAGNAPPAFGPGRILAAPIVSQGDKDGDKRLTKEELAALADAWFEKLDPDKTGKVARGSFVARVGDLLPAPGGGPRPEAAPKARRRRTAPPFNLGAIVGPGLFTALDADKDGSLTRDELRDAFGKWATAWDADKGGTVDEAEARAGLDAALPRPAIGGFERNPRADAAGRELLAEMMSPEALKKYDGVIFLNTTGDVPLPDPDAFYRWIEEGHAFIGMHAAADTRHGDPRYARMLGGEFANHGPQVEVDVLNSDPRHPATAGIGRSLNLFEEIYLFKGYDRSQVHPLLEMDEHPNTEEPGRYPVAWTREQGKGRVFYTSLGHREDVWDPAWKGPDGKRENPPEVAEAYQKHILGGIRWALGLPDAGGPSRADNQRRRGRPRGDDNPLDFDGPKTAAELMISRGDKDGDKRLTKEELTALADDLFDRMDPDRSGRLDPDRFGSGFEKLLPSEEQGFRPTLMLTPGLFAAADVDKNGELTRAELKETFGKWSDRWDSAGRGSLDEEALRAGLKTAWPQMRFRMPGGRNVLDAEVAKGADFSEKPPVTPLPPEEEAKHFRLPEGYRMELVLADPDVEEPVAIAFDGNGRMYVAEMRSYMQDIDGNDEKAPVSRVSRHEDTDGDGVYDRHTAFIDGLVLPRFVLPWDGESVLSMETDADDVFKYTDTDGDGKADRKELFYHGLGRRGNLEHQQSGMVWGMDNWIYTTYNAFRLRWTPGGKILREETGANGGQWGLSMDNDGQMMWVEGGGEIGPLNFQQPIHYGAFSLADELEKDFRIPYGEPMKIADMQGGMARVRMPEGSLNHFTAVSGEDIIRGHRLPADLVGDWVFGEPVARIVRRTKRVVTDGVTQLRNAYPKSEFIRSTDPLFRPVNMSTAPDGTLYVVDMYRGIIQEGTFYQGDSYLRKKIQQYGLDKVKRRGRIWRLRAEGIDPDRTRPRMHDETPAELVRHLAHPNGWWRDTAQRLIVLRQDRSVVPALKEMARSSNRLARTHALWTLEGLGALDADLVREALRSEDPKMRVQGMRLSESLAKGGDSSVLAEVRPLAADADPAVAIQALLTLHYLKDADAPALVRAASEKGKARGVREIAGQLMRPRGGRPEFPPFRFTADQRKLLERGSSIYRELCISCHGPDGRGAPLAGAPEGTTMAPPLAGSPRVTGHRDYTVNVLLHGLIGPVDGKPYQSLMAPMGTNDDEWIAAAASYVRNSFGNSASVVTPAEVAKARSSAGGRSFPWTAAELEASLPGSLRYRPDWKVTASHNPDQAHYAINSPGFVRWDSEAPQREGMWFQVELPRPVAIGEVQLESPGGFGDAPGNYPRGYKVQVSSDGESWSDPVAEGEGKGPITRIALKPVPARFLRITLTKDAKDGASWTIQRTRLFEAVKPTDAENQAPRVGKLSLAEALDAASRTKGDPRRGERLFAELSCVACHTVRADEPPKGPFLGQAAVTYSRRDLAEQVLAPNKVIAKGYETHLLTLKDGRQVEGFVVREGDRAVTVRDAAAREQTIPVAEIDERGKGDKSLMPEGLVANLTVEDLASLLDYLQSLAPAASAKLKP